MIETKFMGDCKAQNVPVSADLDVITLLVDIGTVGDWNLQVCGCCHLHSCCCQVARW